MRRQKTDRGRIKDCDEATRETVGVCGVAINTITLIFKFLLSDSFVSHHHAVLDKPCESGVETNTKSTLKDILRLDMKLTHGHRSGDAC